jgi:hypothetical protein
MRRKIGRCRDPVDGSKRINSRTHTVSHPVNVGVHPIVLVWQRAWCSCPENCSAGAATATPTRWLTSHAGSVAGPAECRSMRQRSTSIRHARAPIQRKIEWTLQLSATLSVRLAESCCGLRWSCPGARPVNRKHWFGLAMSAISLAMVAPSLEAAPMGGIAPSVRTVVGAGWGLERAAHRRCWRQGGRLLCRWFSAPRYHLPDAYYSYAPNTFPTARPPWASSAYSPPSPN